MNKYDIKFTLLGHTYSTCVWARTEEEAKGVMSKALLQKISYDSVDQVTPAATSGKFDTNSFADDFLTNLFHLVNGVR